MKNQFKIILLMIVILQFSFINNSFSNPNLMVKVNDNKILFPDSKPFIDASNRVLVPAKFISESLGAIVEWNSETNTATITNINNKIIIEIGNNIVKTENEDILMDTVPIIKDGRLMLPVKFIAEMLGAKVSWDKINSTVIILTQ